MIRFPSLLAPSIVLLVTCLACGEPRHSAAADVPATDVRRLPPERKTVVPDVMLQAADRGRVVGADSAQVQVLVVSDLQCIECRSWYADQWPSLRATYVDHGLVRATFVNYPLRTHAHAVAAANAVMCAAAQGSFATAFERVMASQSSWSGAPGAQPLLDSIAAATVPDARQLHECTGSGRLLRLIRSDIDWADSVGVRALPAFVVFGSHGGHLAASGNLQAAVDAALKQEAAPPGK